MVRINPGVRQATQATQQREETAANLQLKTAIDQLIDKGPASLSMQPTISADPKLASKAAAMDPSRSIRREIADPTSLLRVQQAEEVAAAQRELERVPAISELRPDIIPSRDRVSIDGTPIAAYENDGMGMAMQRADSMARRFYGTDPKTRLQGAYFPPAITEQLFSPQAQAADIVRGVEGEPSLMKSLAETVPQVGGLSPAAILMDPDGFNAASVQPKEVLDSMRKRYGLEPLKQEGNYAVVDPLLIRMGSFVTEQFIHKNQYRTLETALKAKEGTLDIPDTDANYFEEVFSEKASVNVDSEGKLKRGVGNQELGREVFRAYSREKNKKQGRPTDEFDDQAVTPDQLEVIGTMFKELYADTNPDLYQVERDTANRAVAFKLTTLGEKALKATADAAPGVFEGYEIPPLAAGEGALRKTAAGLGESTRFRKQKTTSLKNQVMPRIEDAKVNMSSIAHGVDNLRSKLLFQVAIPGLKQLKQNIDPSAMPPALLDFVRTGPAKKIKFRAEQNRKVVEQNRQSIFNPQAEQTQLTYDANYEYDKQVVRLIEDLNTIARYSNKANHLTFAVQELQSRMHATQTRFNPQLKPIMRFVTGSLRPSLVEVGSNSKQERSFKELMTVIFLNKQAKTLLPENRIKLFDEEWAKPNHGAFARHVVNGKRIKDSLMSNEQLAKVTNLLKDVKLSSINLQDNNLQGSRGSIASFKRQYDNFTGEVVPTIGLNPEIAQTPMLDIDEEYIRDAANDDFEALKMVEMAHEIYTYDQVQKSESTNSFRSNLNAEPDGIKHGPTSNLANIGVLEAWYRGGILRKEGAERNLDAIPIKDLYTGSETNDELIAGDIAAAVKNYMIDVGPFAAHNFVNGKGKDDVAAKLFQILDVALAKDKDLSKKPVMTMGYGQLLKSLKKQVEDVIITGPASGEIQKLMQDRSADGSEGKLKTFLEDQAERLSKTTGLPYNPDDVVALFIHNVLADGILATLDPKFVNVGQLIRANGVVATFTDELMVVKNAMGIDNYIGGRQAEIKEERGGGILIRDKKSGGSDTAAVPLYRSVARGSALKFDTDPMTGEKINPIPGGHNRSQPIAALIQGMDGAWMNKTFVDDFADLRKETDYMLPIMDAIQTNLDGFQAVREAANKNWFDVIKNYSYVESLFEGWTPGAIDRFRTKLNNMPNEPIRVAMDNEYRAFAYYLQNLPGEFGDINEGMGVLTKLVYDTADAPNKLVTTKGKKGETIASYENKKKLAAQQKVTQMIKDLNMINSPDLKPIESSDDTPGANLYERQLRPAQLLKFFDHLIGPQVLDLKTRNAKTVKQVNEDRDRAIEIQAKAKDPRVFQIDIG